jgi:hypothetical protein
LREERGLRVFENGVLRGVFGCKRDEVTGSGENCIMRSFMICEHFVTKIHFYLNIKIYRTIIVPVVLYGCETWSLTLWEERRLRVFGIGC